MAVAAAARRGSTPWASSSARNQIARRKSHRADCGSGKRHAMCHPRDPLLGVVWFGSVRHDTMGIGKAGQGTISVSPCRCRQVARPGEPHRCGVWLASSLPGLWPPAARQVLAGRSATTTINNDGKLGRTVRPATLASETEALNLGTPGRQARQAPRDISKWQQHGGGRFHMAPVEAVVVVPMVGSTTCHPGRIQPRLVGGSAKCLARIL